MQITRAEVIPFDLQLRQPVLMAHHPQIKRVKAIFVRLETRQGQNAWGCTVTHSTLTGDKYEEVLRQCHECASLAPDLHPTNIEFSLTELANRTKATPTTMCAFDLAFHDLLGLASGMPLYRLLGGYRNRIQTSATVPIAPLQETIETARALDRQGFRMLKIKGGLDPEDDVRRVQAVHRALPHSVLRLDADGGYSVEEALDVARALGDVLEMIEQPTLPYDHAALRQVKELSPVPVLADQSVSDPASALELAAGRMTDGLSVKLATCGGLHCARQVDAIARAARIATMVGCFIEPALLISAGLCLALSSPNVRYADLDGHLNLANDPSHVPFTLEDGWLVASDAPGLGYFQL
jgi:L-Ala-D/L-Glu epimerase